MNDKLRNFFKWSILVLLPILLCAFIYFSHPFNQELASRTIDVSELASNQTGNIQTSIKALDGYILKPGEVFSFNRVVGPRTFKRGYFEAPSYLSGASAQTYGGGICLVSSAIYQLALNAGLPIVERLPHDRTVKSILPGLDATVWYGRSDLRFKNTLSMPLQIKASYNGNNVTVKLLAQRNEDLDGISLRRLVTRRSKDEIQVEVFRQIADKTTLVSRDLYRLSP